MSEPGARHGNGLLEVASTWGPGAELDLGPGMPRPDTLASTEHTETLVTDSCALYRRIWAGCE